jgi:hypothetical protein
LRAGLAKVEDGQKPNIQQIARDLEGMGIRVSRVMKVTGIITGESGGLTLRQVKIKGIQKVERDRNLKAK